VEEEPFGEEKALYLCNLVEEEHCGRRMRENRTNAVYFFKMFSQMNACAHHTKKPGTLPPITVRFKNIKITHAT